MEDICTPSTDPLPPPSYAEVQKKDRRHRVAKGIVVCCVVVVALAVGWCIPGPAYIRTRGNTEVTYEVYVTSTDWISKTNTREVYVTQTNTRVVYVTETNTQEAYVTHTNTQEVYVTHTNTQEVYVTHTNWISPSRSSKCATITRTIPQTVFVTSTQVQTVTRYVQPTPSPTEKPVCPYTYPAGYKDGQDGRTDSYWSPRFRSDKDYMKGYFEGFYNYTPYCISSQRLSF